MSLRASQEPLLVACDKQELLEGGGPYVWDIAAEQFQGTVTLCLATPTPTPEAGEARGP